MTRIGELVFHNLYKQQNIDHLISKSRTGSDKDNAVLRHLFPRLQAKRALLQSSPSTFIAQASISSRRPTVIGPNHNLQRNYLEFTLRKVYASLEPKDERGDERRNE
jgi:hypothetical protein